jgi:hypothetical protein
MEAIKQIVRTPKNHEIRVKIPQHIPENELVEVIVIGLGTQRTDFDQKINALKAAMRDKLFLSDLRNLSKDFEAVDREEWEA